jgi:hypothetical protein
MTRILPEIAFLLTALLLCFSCESAHQVSTPKPDTQFFSPKSSLSAEIFEKLGYQVKSFDEGPPSEWLKEQFQTVWSRDYQVKVEHP